MSAVPFEHADRSRPRATAPRPASGLVSLRRAWGLARPWLLLAMPIVCITAAVVLAVLAIRAEFADVTIHALATNHDREVSTQAAPEVLLARIRFLLGHDRVDEVQPFVEALDKTGSDRIRAIAHYDFANGRLRQAFDRITDGKLEEAGPLVVLSSQEYRRALTFEPEDWDAKFNLDVASRLIRDFPSAVIAAVEVGKSPAGIVLDRAARRLYVADRESDDVSVVDAAAFRKIATIPVGRAPYALALSPDGGRLYVADVRSNDIQVLDTRHLARVGTVPVGSMPYGVAVTPDGTTALSTNQHAGTLSVIDATSLTVVATIDVGRYPEGVICGPGGRAYVANWFSDDVSVIDVPGRRELARIKVGDGPRAFAAAARAELPASIALASRRRRSWERGVVMKASSLMTLSNLTRGVRSSRKCPRSSTHCRLSSLPSRHSVFASVRATLPDLVQPARNTS